MQMDQFEDEYTRVLHYDMDKEEQIRITVSRFRHLEYLGIRKYYLDFNEEWQPSNVGISMPLTFENSRELFAALVEILSLAESKSIVEEHFKDLIDEMYQ